MNTIGFYADKLYISDNLWRERMEDSGFFYMAKTFSNMKGIAKNQIIPLWGDYEPDKLTPKIIKAALKPLRLAGSTKNRILKYLENIYRYLMEEGIVNYNPVNAIIRYSRKQKMERGIIPDREMSLLFPESHNELLKIWPTQRYLCAFLIFRDTGLRPGELSALQWEDWYPEEMFFPITKAIEGGTKDKIKYTKTGVHRPALVTPQTETELELLRKTARQAPNHFIFSGLQNNVPYDSHRYCYTLRRALSNAGINKPEYTTYWFRHTFNTKALEKYPEEKVRKLMGHKTAGMTIHYRHPNLEILKREAKALRDKI